MIRWFVLHVVWPIQDRWFEKMMQEERQAAWRRRNG